MKFDTSDFLKMGGTAIVTALIVVAIYNSGSTPTYEPSKSERISWVEAAKLISEYESYKPIQVADTNPTTGAIEAKALKGFKMNARQIDEIINHNKHTSSTDSTADEIIFYFGNEGISTDGTVEFGNLRIIAAGIKNGVVLKNDKDAANAKESSIFDRADPCPPSSNCPTIK